MVGAKDFKLYGSLVSDQIKLHGWLVFHCPEGEERIIFAKKERSFIKSSQEKTLSLANRRSGHFCLTRNRQTSDVSVEYWLKKGTEINSQIVTSEAVITSLGKHVFSEEFIQGNNTIG